MKCGGDRLHQLNKVAVYTDSDLGVILEGLDVDIRRVHSEGVLKDGGSQLNDRRVVNTVVGSLCNEILQGHLLFLFLGSLLNDSVGGALGIELADSSGYRTSHAHSEGDRAACDTSQVLHCIEVRGVVGSNSQTPSGKLDGDTVILSCLILRYLLYDIREKLHLINIDELDVQTLSKHLCELIFGDETHLLDKVTHLFALVLFIFLRSKYLIKVLLRDKTLFDQMFTDRYVLHIIKSPSPQHKLIAKAQTCCEEPALIKK